MSSMPQNVQESIKAAFEEARSRERKVLLGSITWVLLVVTAVAIFWYQVNQFAVTRNEIALLEEKSRDEIAALKAQADTLKERYDKLDIVPIGAMVPFFAEKLPKGYVWADGKSNFPDAAWVPVHLRGTKIPDMAGQLVGGTNDEANIGLVYDKGLLKVPGVTIRGSSFQLPATKSEVTQIAAGQGSHKEGGFVAVPTRNDNYPPNKGGIFWGSGFGVQKIDGAPATYNSFKNSEPLAGGQEIPAVQLRLNTPETNPRHIMCRWIIRVE
jgi:hypothetical protein